MNKFKPLKSKHNNTTEEVAIQLPLIMSGCQANVTNLESNIVNG